MSNLTPKLADAIILSKPQQVDLNKRLIDYTGAEFLQLLADNVSSQIPDPDSTSKMRFCDTDQARLRLAGNNQKPISNPTFNKLRREGKITTYFPSPGRVAFDLDEIDNYIASQGKKKSLLVKNKSR